MLFSQNSFPDPFAFYLPCYLFSSRNDGSDKGTVSQTGEVEEENTHLSEHGRFRNALRELLDFSIKSQI